MKGYASAKEVADYLVWLAAHEKGEDRDFLTPLRLQKLLYFVQGWTLAEWNSPMFDEPIEAWQHGPVVPTVWRDFKELGNRPIVDDIESPPEIGDAVKSLIHSVWDSYKHLSALGIADLTHAQERPYIEAYRPDRTGRSDRTIPISRMASWFGEQAQSPWSRSPAKREQLRSRARLNTIRLTGKEAI